MTTVMSTHGLDVYFRSLVHDAVRADELAAARHQSFIASHMIGGFLALVIFPVYLAAIGQPSLLSGVAFAWLISPILIAVYLSRSGQLEHAHLISAVNLTGLVTFAASITGGMSSFLIAWMIIVPMEAALSADRRVVITAICIAALALLGLSLAGVAGVLPAAQTFTKEPVILAFLGSMSALVYAGGLAVSVQNLYGQSEEEIRRSEKRYRLLAENATDMITRHNARGQVLFASIASELMLGVSSRMLLGSGLFERIHVADRPAYLNALSRSVELNESVSVEFRVRSNASGGAGNAHSVNMFHWVEMRCRPVVQTENNDGAHEIVAVTRDISARKEQEDELLRARDNAESASQAKTHFLANMSHELRTPLNAIIGFSEILSREMYGRIGEERYREYAHLIHESGEHLLSVVNEVLDMSKIEAGKFDIIVEPFNVDGLVNSCCEIMRHQGEKKSITIQMETGADMPELVADKRACKQILLNLLANAIKFTDEGGSVKVLANRLRDDIELVVEDNGIGIATQDIPKLGSPFVQAESSYDRGYEGAGLGLSVVKGLVRLHGGSFDIDSELGEGTRVRIRLPINGISDAPLEENETLDGHVPLDMAISA